MAIWNKTFHKEEKRLSCFKIGDTLEYKAERDGNFIRSKIIKMEQWRNVPTKGMIQEVKWVKDVKRLPVKYFYSDGYVGVYFIIKVNGFALNKNYIFRKI